MTPIYEAEVEDWVINLLQEQGYSPLSAEEQETERDRFSDVLLRRRLEAAIGRLNPELPAEVRTQALQEVVDLPGDDPIKSNEVFYQMLVEGVRVEHQRNGERVGATVQLIDFANPMNNDFAVCNQITVQENKAVRRPDVALFVNGMPLVVMELKNPTDPAATVEKAFHQLQTYKQDIPTLFCYNGVLVASDGHDAKAGSLTAGRDRFMEWKTVDGKKEDSPTTPQLETLVKGMLRPKVLLDLVRHFTIFEKTTTEDAATGARRIETIKKIAAYHQYHAVKEAVKSTLRAVGKNAAVEEEPGTYGLPDVRTQPLGDRKAGVVWHTQGSGKSLSMVFYAGLLIVHPDMANPTIVVITDRNDLDDQLFRAFDVGAPLLRQAPKQAESRADLKQLLRTGGGGVVFSTIQKFSPEEGETFELLSERENIVVIADEAHRSQYGFAARTLFTKDGATTRYGFAKYLRDALPCASLIGFTGTPIERKDASTPAVFGNYIDVYDIEQAIEDGATVPIHYASRLVQVHLKDEDKKLLDAEVEAITENEEATAAEQAKAKLAKLEAIVGHEARRKKVTTDILAHFDARQKTLDGKAIIVSTSRRIAVAMYEDIIAMRPEWHEDEVSKGSLKVIMTSSASDPLEWRKHSTTKQERKLLRQRFQDPEDPLRLVIVRDMWLTGFDAPCLHTLYVDKMMRDHNLMQAIARVNRVFKDKPSGLVVDYIGIASDLKQAVTSYTENGGKGTPVREQEKAVETMLEQCDVVVDMLSGVDYQAYFSADADIGEKMKLILNAQEHILGLEEGKKRFITAVDLLSRAFSMSVPHAKAMAIREKVAFFQAVKARLVKFKREGGGASDVDVETAIRQIVDRSLVVGEVIDVFAAAGIKKPDVSILSDEFLEEAQGMERKNLALELLKKVLRDQINAGMKKNLVQGKKFSEMLENALRRYQNHMLTTAQVINELIELAKEIRDSEARAEELKREFELSDDEVAFYDALAMNQSAVEVLGDEALRGLAQKLVEQVEKDANPDWTIRENARAKLRTIVKRLLNKYGYPPDKQQMATEKILEQAESFAEEWSAAAPNETTAGS